MSISVKFKSPVPSVFPTGSPETPSTYHPPRIAEAPDRGYTDRDARDGRSAEAPDAGYGRMGLLEHEFTHGRSQS